jgi:hypothetical protein
MPITRARVQQRHHITAIHGGERDGKSPSPTLLAGLGPSDFYLFGYMKHCLRGQSFEAADEFFSALEGY